jgi:acyl carrier protein
VSEKETINGKITEILSEISLNNNSEDYSSETKLKEDLCLDSLGFINLVMELNNSFNIEIKSTEIVFENLKQLAVCVSLS